MRFIGVVGIIFAVLGLVGGPIGYVAATTVFQQIVGGIGTITGTLGLVVAAIGFGFAEMIDIARAEDKSLKLIIQIMANQMPRPEALPPLPIIRPPEESWLRGER